jgi:putative membrane protein
MADLLYPKNEKLILRTILIVSIAVPVLVAVLLFSPYKINASMQWVKHLPAFHAFVNSITAVLLVLGLYFVRKGQIARHRGVMLAAMGFGALFLLSYVVYHGSVPNTLFGDINGDGVRDAAETAAAGNSLNVYFAVLISHIIFAAIVLPFVLMAAYFALTDKIKQHRKVVRWAFPLWLYVSITGVVVYFMIKPFYQF